MPKPSNIAHFPAATKKAFMTTPIRCPYTQGKMTLQKIKKRSLETIYHAINLLHPKKNLKSYDATLSQMNEEKELEYLLQNDQVSTWVDTALNIYKDTRGEISIGELRRLVHMDYGLAFTIIQRKFLAINYVLKTEHADIYAVAMDKSSMIKELRTKGVRKSTPPKSGNEFDGMAEESIVMQLVANTASYLQYLVSKHPKEDENTLVDISSAPRFRYFSVQFGGALRKVLLDTMKEFLVDNNMKDFYGEGINGMSPKAEGMLQEKLKYYDGATYNSIYSKIGGLPGYMDPPDGNIYGCPVQKTFKKFYPLVISILAEHMQKKFAKE